jgi:hypothetical protein
MIKYFVIISFGNILYQYEYNNNDGSDTLTLEFYKFVFHTIVRLE